MFCYYFKQLKSNKTKLKLLARDFFARRISAAGVSYILNQKSRLRRYLWLIGVIACFLFMGYMTINILWEYLSYPKMLIKEDVIMSRLPFPAVTVCSLNPISETDVEQTSLNKLQKLKKLLNNTFVITSRAPRTMSRCMKEPLCKWSWFLEICECVENPCLTEHCLPSNDTHCVCSASICKKTKYGCSDIENDDDTSESLCLCDSSFDVNNRSFVKIRVPKLEEILEEVEDPDVKDVIQLVWNSNSYDLTDVEEGLMPTLDDIYRYGISFDSLVASCSFEKERCVRDNFTTLYHPKYGKCYMFNYVGGSSSDPVQPLDTNNYGSNSGLKLLLRVSDQNISDLVRRELGVRIVIHDPQQLPFVSEYGMNVRPLDMTAIGVSMSTMHRLPKPWGNCEDDKNFGTDGEPYTTLGCEKQCGFKYMTEECNCTMRHLMHGSVLSKNTTKYHLCNLNNSTQKKCVEKVIAALESRVVDCHCHPPCNETIYSYSVTSSQLNINYFDTVKAIRTLRIHTDGKLAYIKFQDNKTMIGVKIYYNTFQVSKQSEVQSYSWETLIANIGGNLGFFMGLTLVTFLEIVEFMWDVLITACKIPKDNKVYTAPNKSKLFRRKLRKIKGNQCLRRNSI